MSQPKFPVGEFIVTRRARAAVPEAEIMRALARHESGDWGHLTVQDKNANNRALETASRVLSVYWSEARVKFWIITEGDRSVTTVLLPSDY
jgi:hypothetical protein